ncbi:hypothetical protein [Terriglobus sp.]|uniref:hypothetical protein n=1 Tax=Terriglobus sp. TaxID=1889013 RepID=UPI003B0017AE
MSERWNEIDDLDLLQLEAEMHGDLQELREAATVYADRAWKRGAGAAPARAGVRTAARHGWLAWIAAGFAAAVLAVGGTRLAHRPAGQDAVVVKSSAAQMPASALSDEALLQQIQSDLSNGVPTAMEPLQASSGSQDAVKR